MKSLFLFLKNWTLPIAMTCGIMGYFIYTGIPALLPTRMFVHNAVAFIQPALIFSMLFITFCKVDPHHLRLRRWHGWLLLIQTTVFSLLSLILIVLSQHLSAGSIAIVEGAMLCFICPTATAGAVVTARLGGDAAGLTTYTIFINIAAAVIVPLFLPLIHPHPELDFLNSFSLIVGKVFPMLICPFFAAMLIRRLFPRIHNIILKCKDLAFYLWAIALSVAIAITVRSIVHTNVSLINQIGIAFVSLISCVIQFRIGRYLGKRYGCPISAGQSLGQKNTVFAIWMGYTFLTPVSAIAGGFYSVWHNIFNSWQLYEKRKKEAYLSER